MLSYERTSMDGYDTKKKGNINEGNKCLRKIMKKLPKSCSIHDKLLIKKALNTRNSRNSRNSRNTKKDRKPGRTNSTYFFGGRRTKRKRISKATRKRISKATRISKRKRIRKRKTKRKRTLRKK